MSSREVDGSVPEVIGADFLGNPRFSGTAIRIGDDRDVLAVLLQWFYDESELKIAAFLQRSPKSNVVTVRRAARATVHNFDCCKPALRRCRRVTNRSLRRHHGLQERQRNRRS